MVSKSYRTQRNYQAKIIQALENIYISTTETCNLACRYCYTNKNLPRSDGAKPILSNKQILDFVKKYDNYLKSSKFRNLKSVLFCGGEVFLLANFTSLINTLIQKNIFITIITNGTIDKLSQIKNPSNCQLLVSLDGPKAIHDQNRGQGNFDKTKKFIKHALSLGFPTEIFFLVTKDSYPYINSFNLFDLPKTYLTDRLHSLTLKQVLNIKQNYPTYPAKNFDCFQLALQSNGLIYGCCESSVPLAKMTDPIPKIVKSFANSLSTCKKCQFCLGCTDPNFLCGYTKELNCKTCQQVVKTFN